MLLNDYPVTLMKYKTYPVLGETRIVHYFLCDKHVKHIADLAGNDRAYNFERLVDYGSCSVCGINTVKKHLYIKSMNMKKGKR